ncbi:DUF4422 domain-containing protein [Vibrio cincinnatiensis]
MKSIIVHIGMHKTASSSIQKILSIETNLLNNSKIVFPVSGRINNEMHHALAYDIIESFNTSYKFFYGSNAKGKSWDNLYSELGNDNRDVVLSSEEFYRILTICGIDGLTKLKDKLLKLSNNLKIIVYLRKQDDFFNSAYNQCIKFDNIIFTPAELGSKLKINELDYYQQLSAWAHVFGKENLIVRSFDKNLLYKNDIIHDFFKIINIPLNSDVNIDYNENVSLPLSFLEIRRQINSIDIEYPKFRDEINKIINDLSYVDSFKNVFSMSKYYYESNVETWDDVNNKISKEFLNGDELFSKRFKNSNELTFVNDCKIDYELIVSEFDLYIKNNFVSRYTVNLFFKAIKNIVEKNNRLMEKLEVMEYKNGIRNNISIYTTHYQYDVVIDSPCVVPIHVGHALAKDRFYDVTDSTGDNISERNPTFCELTAHYWVWKNKLDSDYIGFMHHRRHLCFNEKNNDKKNAWGLINYPEINNEYISKCGLDEQTIQKLIKDYDILVAEQWDVRITGNKSNYDLYKNTDFLHIEDYEVALSILVDWYPEFKPYIEEYNNSYLGFYTNIFVMKKDIFVEYAEWIFPLLFEVEKCIDISKYSSVEKRVIGHIAERLVGIYMLKLLREGKYKIKELKRTIVDDTTPKNISISESDIKLKTIATFSQDDKYVPIVVNFNEAYSHVAGACLQSIISNSSPEFNYDIFILGNKVSEKSISRYHDMVEIYTNINITYIDVSQEIFIQKLSVNQYFSIETYFRLFVPKIFSQFEKVIYLDVDMIVNTDLSELMKVKFDQECIAAVPCYVMKSFIENKVVSNSETGNLIASEYLDKYLGVKDNQSYIQAGLIVFNNIKLNEIDFVNKIIAELDTVYWFLDQDIINKILNGRIKLLPFNWNVMHGNNDVNKFISLLPVNEKNKYLEARESPYIVHYAGPEKPWNNKEVEFSDLYWKNFQKTLWFTDLVFYASNATSNINNHYQPPKYKVIMRKSFDYIFPLGTNRRVIFSRYYKKFRGL